MVRVLPVGQKKLTNVSIVKYKCGKKLFEIACYRNKVIAWRLGQETNISEVLQVDSIFANVELGDEANREELKKAFPNRSYEEIIKIILDKGDMQVTDAEREVLSENLFKRVSNFVAERVLDPLTGNPISMEVVQEELKRIGFALIWNGDVKPEGLKALALLESKSNKKKLRRAWFRIEVPELDEITRIKLFQNVIMNIVEGSTYTFEVHPRDYGTISRVLDNQSYKYTLVSTFVNPVLPEDLNSQHPAPDVIGGSSIGPIVPDGSGLTPHIPSPAIQKSKCSTCNIVFENVKDFRKHYKSEWHIFNTKRKTRGLEVIDEELFDDLEEDLRKGFMSSAHLE